MPSDDDISDVDADRDETRALVEDALDASHEPYESQDEFALDLAVVLKRALLETDEDVITSTQVASTLTRWRATMTGEIVLPITLDVMEACEILDRLGGPDVEQRTITLPVDEHLLHDLDSQLDLVMDATAASTRGDDDG